MTTPRTVRTTRRSALKGLGLIGGAAAVGVAPGWETAGAHGRSAPGSVGTDDEPIGGGEGRVGGSLTTAGLSYLTYGMFAFQPDLFGNGYVVTRTGCYSNTFDGFVMANLSLPTGAVVKEVQFAGQNSSISSAGFFLERRHLEGGGSVVAQVGIPPGGAVIQVATAVVDHVVDPDYSYDAGVYTSSEVRMYSCRIGFAGPFGSFPVTPQVRKLDTRAPGPLTGKFLVGHVRTLGLTPELPAGAAAALVNVTVTDTVGGGFLSLFPDGTSWPGTSTVNWSSSGQTIANSSTVVVSAGGAVMIFCSGSAGAQAHVIVDLVGYLR